jgi:protein-S-isoprenylcysteine O-methyltransferase Ste14/rhodanese-related sulfurtransferase
LAEGSTLTVITYVTAAVGAAICFSTGSAVGDPGIARFTLALALAVPAGFLLVFSAFGLIAYFLFIPSISNDAHIFARVHAGQLVHPLTTAVVLGLLAVALYIESLPGLIAWVALLGVYSFQTALMVSRIRSELAGNGLAVPGSSFIFLLLNLILGGELVTIAAGAKPLPPWRLHLLPEDTWIVDIRTKPEFKWNRMQAAENYPWGAGLTEAADSRPKDRPVLVTCLSGHRSPAFTIMLRRLGFTTVYNLNWGILYLILLEKGRKTTGPFSLTRSQRDANMRGEDFRGISIGYISMALLVLVCAPLERVFWPEEIPLVQQVLALVIGLGGLVLGILSYLALGRNFRVFAAPRRSGALITTGVYSKVRHPMYTAVVMAIGGYALYFGSIISIPFWLGCTIFYVIKAFKEEPLLLAHYPDYEEYKRRTWMFVPYVF